MVLVTGECSFQEWRSRTDARLFALCSLGEEQLRPISLPNHTAVPGIACRLNGQYFALKLGDLPPHLTHIFMGLTVPAGHDLSEADYRLQLRFGDSSSRSLHERIVEGAGRRYALLAVVLRTPDGAWNAQRLETPQLFTDKSELSKKYPVPEWWLSIP